MDAEAWWGFLAPSKTPKEIVGRLNSELTKALSSAHLMDALDKQGVVAAPSSPEKMSAMIDEDQAFIAKLVQSIKFSVEQ
jgi:tripartite-type tricarboxylate transporter receptor subunit TctC